ncbi:GNAT family N-acetyltransferase [Streptacidiphilus sp. PB12-B1b]|uniref:GNAT family N-acetyltransferase n=1 Tax=Streptacidiphilus sp. PB12-B1b TaxID=2705012 RepID=UPI0015FDE945|nr:GNAT family N-acetyltransferase [Streptacidiphilus sp. PB12-B1b]QMU76684.1 GNAT family N-acetyltransferase [Streptacidiphilus sp. PB12-B1b]
MPVESLGTAATDGSPQTRSRTGAATAPRPGEHGLEVRPAVLSDPLVQPLLRELEYEYSTRYPALADAGRELERYPAEEFEPAHGGLLVLLLEAGEPVAGGAYRRYDPRTAELKRIWTHSAHRRRGLARRVVRELELAAEAAGYQRVYLTTGPRQPEAKGLYLATGYTALFDVEADPESLGGPLPFAKSLTGAEAVRPEDFRPTPRVDFGSR